MLTRHSRVAERADSAVADALALAPALAQVAVEPVAAKKTHIQTFLSLKEKANKLYFEYISLQITKKNSFEIFIPRRVLFYLRAINVSFI